MSEIIHKPPEFKPDLLLLVSGKRKCGKDYFTEILVNRFGQENTAVMRIAAPIKHFWAVKNNLDYEKLLDTSAYKEQHRFEMVKWSQEVRQNSYGYFNVEAIRMSEAEGKSVWICADIRHKKDYKWFLEFYPPDRIKRIRITASQDVRIARGWKYTLGVDDGPSECDLDDVTDWDLVITNNGDSNLDDSADIIQKWLQKSSS